MPTIPRRALPVAAGLVASLSMLLAACGAGGLRPPAEPVAAASAPSPAPLAPRPPADSTVIIVDADTPAPPLPAIRPATSAPTPGPALAAAEPATRTVILSGKGVPVVVLDPGHGGEESGAAAYGVVERDSNLDMAERTARHLRAAGVDAVLTREDANRAVGAAPGNGFSATRADLQTRVHLANQVGAAVFVSLHSNGSPDPSTRGVEVYWESRRTFGPENLRLAEHLLRGVVDGLAAAGYPTRDRGTIDAACWRNNNGRCIGLFVLSPGGATVAPAPQGTPGAQATPSAQAAPFVVKEATNMPAALVESLFVSNVEDAALLRSDAAREAIARGLSSAILRYLGRAA